LIHLQIFIIDLLLFQFINLVLLSLKMTLITRICPPSLQIWQSMQ